MTEVQAILLVGGVVSASILYSKDKWIEALIVLGAMARCL